jgi:hypothetical protein
VPESVVRRAWLLAGVVVASAPSARAADRDACVDAYVGAQSARKGGSLLAARRQLEMCTDAACPGMIRRDCAEWLEQVNKALPSVVLVARDEAGHDLLGATATVDGGPVRIDGRTVLLDPGKHVVRVRTAAGEQHEEAIVLAEGEHDRAVVVVFPSAVAPPAPQGPAPAEPQPASEGARRVPVASWVLGGLGVVALGLSGAFAIRGASDRTSLGCDRGCGNGQYDSVNREFIVADVALVAGVALLGAAAVVWLTQTHPGSVR